MCDTLEQSFFFNEFFRVLLSLFDILKLFNFYKQCWSHMVYHSEYFFGMFSSFNEFKEVFDQCTDDYGCLVLDRTEAHKSSNSCVKWYKASLDIPTFKIGDKFYFNNDAVV